MEDNVIIQQGWECPKCGRIYSPNCDMCKFCGNEEIIVNTGNKLILDFPVSDVIY
jgi:uncharacterized OB-fold protein